MDNIDRIFVINLEHRKDRLAEFYIQMEKTKIDLSKVERFNAFYKPFNDGALGCTMSHLEILKIAKERKYKNVLIFEDDFEFLVTAEDFEQKMRDFFTLQLDWNVLMLSYLLQHSKPFNLLLGITNEAQTTSGYLVNGEYFDTLINCLEINSKLLLRTKQHWFYTIDQAWKSLQKEDNKWFYFTERCGKQRASLNEHGILIDYGF